METINFTTWKDEPQQQDPTKKGQNLEFTVKSEFAQKCPDYLTTPSLDLIQKFEIMLFFHNPNGPAVIDHKSNTISYFLDGKPVTNEEEIKKIKHRSKHREGMEKVLTNETL